MNTPSKVLLCLHSAICLAGVAAIGTMIFRYVFHAAHNGETFFSVEALGFLIVLLGPFFFIAVSLYLVRTYDGILFCLLFVVLLTTVTIALAFVTDMEVSIEMMMENRQKKGRMKQCGPPIVTLAIPVGYFLSLATLLGRGIHAIWRQQNLEVEGSAESDVTGD